MLLAVLISLLSIVVVANIFFGTLYLIDVAGEVGFFVKKPVEGRFIAIMKGGVLHKIIYSIEGWKLDEETGRMVIGKRTKGWWERHFGVQWIGRPFTYSVFQFKLSWDEFGKKTGVRGQTVVSVVDQMVESLFFQHTYALVLEGAETSGNIPLGMTAQITLRRTYPKRTMFRLGTPLKALETVTGLALNKARQQIRLMNLDEILGLGHGDESEVKLVPSDEVQRRIIQAIIGLNENADLAGIDIALGTEDDESVGSLSSLTGYEIVSVAIENIVPELTDAEIGLLRAEPLARKEAARKIALAEGDSKVLRLLGDARRDALAAEAEAMSANPRAAELRRLQAIADSNLVTLGGGEGTNLLIQPEKRILTPDDK